MSNKIEEMVKSIFEMRDEPAAKAEKAARKPLPKQNTPRVAPKPPAIDPKLLPKKQKSRFEPMRKVIGEAAKGVGHVSWVREPSDREVAAGASNALGTEKIPQSNAVTRAGGSADTYQKIKASPDKEKQVNPAPVHYQKDAAGNDTTRRDLKAGPKGHSARNTFEPSKKTAKGADNYNPTGGVRTNAMPIDDINRSGVAGKTVKKDGQDIPSERWSALKSALANRKFNRSMKNIPDGN